MRLTNKAGKTFHGSKIYFAGDSLLLINRICIHSSFEHARKNFNVVRIFTKHSLCLSQRFLHILIDQITLLQHIHCMEVEILHKCQHLFFDFGL